MTDTKHTVGPWQCVGITSFPTKGRLIVGNQFIVVAPDSADAFKICGLFAEVPKDEVEANGLLIAAAPAMLAALKEMTDGLEIEVAAGIPMLERALKALAQAEGRPEPVFPRELRNLIDCPKCGGIFGPDFSESVLCPDCGEDCTSVAYIEVQP